jgi:hypothetical protein
VSKLKTRTKVETILENDTILTNKNEKISVLGSGGLGNGFLFFEKK